jgi:hypothetical protein
VKGEKMFFFEKSCAVAKKRQCWCLWQENGAGSKVDLNFWQVMELKSAKKGCKGFG